MKSETPDKQQHRIGRSFNSACCPAFAFFEPSGSCRK
jgi:hypothetical protein